MPATKRAAKPIPKKVAAKKVCKGVSYSCEVCGLVVSVDTACGCREACDIICCGEPMQEHKVKGKKVKA